MRFIRSIISARASRQWIITGNLLAGGNGEVFVVEVGNRSRVEPHCHRSEIGIVDVHGVHAGKGVEINVRQHQMSHTGLDGALYGFVAVGVEFLEIQMAMSVDHNGYDVG